MHARLPATLLVTSFWPPFLRHAWSAVTKVQSESPFCNRAAVTEQTHADRDAARTWMSVRPYSTLSTSCTTRSVLASSACSTSGRATPRS